MDLAAGYARLLRDRAPGKWFSSEPAREGIKRVWTYFIVCLDTFHGFSDWRVPLPCNFGTLSSDRNLRLQNASSLKKLTPEVYAAKIAANREIVEGIPKKFYYLVSASAPLIITFSPDVVRIHSTQLRKTPCSRTRSHSRCSLLVGLVVGHARAAIV